MKKLNLPMQPIYRDDNGVIRFVPNKIVRFLLDWASARGMNLNELALMQFSNEDETQFAQLIGYSVSGFGELSYVNKKIVDIADEEAAKLLEGK